MTVLPNFGIFKGSDPIPNYEDIRRPQEEEIRKARREMPLILPPEIAAESAKATEIADRLFAPPKEILAPNANRVVLVIPGTRVELNQKWSSIKDTTVTYGVGKITYYDTRREKLHTTRFCLVSYADVGFRYCPTGNDMD
jgi:hypothetical protein